MDFLRKVNSCLDVKIGSTLRLRFSTKFHFKWTFKNGLQLWQLKTNLMRFKSLKTLQPCKCRLYHKLKISTILCVYFPKSKKYNLRMHKFLLFFIFFNFMILTKYVVLPYSLSACKDFYNYCLFCFSFYTLCKTNPQIDQINLFLRLNMFFLYATKYSYLLTFSCHE